MKIRYFSDLHLEFIKYNEIEKFFKNIECGHDEILICAGDIGNPYQNNYDIFINFINNNFKKIFIIAGNHEYYNKTKNMNETNIYLVEYFAKFENITFLNNNYEYYENYCFIGSTLWSKITNPVYEINDVYSIPNFDYIEYNKLNVQCIDFLQDALNNKNCVVITHHMPLESLIDIKYKTFKMLPYNQWFYNDLAKLIETKKDNIKCWIYGHTHTPSNNIVNEIPFLCNPIGYPNENAKNDFQKNIIIDI